VFDPSTAMQSVGKRYVYVGLIYLTAQETVRATPEGNTVGPDRAAVWIAHQIA
jgi:hypothetical protein